MAFPTVMDEVRLAQAGVDALREREDLHLHRTSSVEQRLSLIERRLEEVDYLKKEVEAVLIRLSFDRDRYSPAKADTSTPVKGAPAPVR